MNGWLGEALAEWFGRHTKDEAVEKLLAVGLPVGPVQNAQDIFDCPQVAARKQLIDVPDPVLGTVRLVGSPIKLSGSPEPVTNAAPSLGEHTAEILREVLGYPEEEVNRLQAEGVL